MDKAFPSDIFAKMACVTVHGGVQLCSLRCTLECVFFMSKDDVIRLFDFRLGFFRKPIHYLEQHK